MKTNNTETNTMEHVLFIETDWNHFYHGFNKTGIEGEWFHLDSPNSTSSCGDFYKSLTGLKRSARANFSDTPWEIIEVRWVKNEGTFEAMWSVVSSDFEGWKNSQ